MVRKNKCKKLGFSTILWAVAAIMLCTGACVWALEIPNDGVEYKIPSESIPQVNGDLVVYGTVNLLPGAHITGQLKARPGSTINISGGQIGQYLITYTDPLQILEDPDVTVYGDMFQIGNGGFFLPSSDPNPTITSFLTLNIQSELGYFGFIVVSDIPIHLRALTKDPEQMLFDLGIYILDQVEDYQEPIPPDIELIGIAPEMEVSLLTKVDAALAALAKGNPNDAKVAMNDMKALIKQVLAQTYKKISLEASDGIQEYVDAIIAALGS